MNVDLPLEETLPEDAIQQVPAEGPADETAADLAVMEVAVATAPKKSIWVEEAEEEGSAAAIMLAPLLHWHKPLMRR
eukprot:109302-Chlamydomonas_euryale.AAC.1